MSEPGQGIPHYEAEGATYTDTRRPDPRIAALVEAALGGARSVVNIGAGAGSYEPRDREVVAVEPSAAMRAQRPPGLAPALAGTAEALPLADASVDAALAVLTVHHWVDLDRAFAEIRRVARERAVFVTFDPDAGGFWLEDYFPVLWAFDRPLFPAPAAFSVLGETEIRPLPVPHDCTDGFVGAFWRRPRAYLDPAVRRNMSGFARVPTDDLRAGLQRLAGDLATGAWARDNAGLLDRETFDVGYRLVTCRLGG